MSAAAAGGTCWPAGRRRHGPQRAGEGPALERLLGTVFLPASVYLISRMPSDPRAADVLPIALISLALAFVATLYPSWRASRVRYE